MNKLLPDIYDLKPIHGNRDTFGETKFNRKFSYLSFKEKLQIANDLIRQTMLTNMVPDPKDELETMCGDSYTASIVAIEYLREMKLGKKHFLVLARKKKYEIDNITTKHFLVLVFDKDNECYQFDCSPFVGYKCGKVENIKIDRFYEEYYPVEGEVKELLNEIRLAKYEIHTNGETYINIEAVIHKASRYHILRGYILELNSILGINTLQVGNEKSEEAKNKLLKQIEEWKVELNELIRNNENYERQIELSQCITQEWKKYDFSLERFFIYNEEKIPLSHLTPRYFYENKMNLVIIKPSSYLIGVNNTIREKFLHKGNGAIGEYKINLGSTSKDGIKIMRIFHPDGYKYEQSMFGICNVFLVRKTSKYLQETKHELRNSLGKNMSGHEVLWFDNKLLMWNPIITNLVHSTDNSSETCCHYLSPFPEHQLMTRYMYPNLKLIF